jgi:hypothetical protein
LLLLRLRLLSVLPAADPAFWRAMLASNAGQRYTPTLSVALLCDVCPCVAAAMPCCCSLGVLVRKVGEPRVMELVKGLTGAVHLRCCCHAMLL